MAADLFGWDLIYRSVENDVQRREDLLVAFTHWYIIKNGFSCIGNGDSKVITGQESKGEGLPAGWNQGSDYNLRYVYDDRLYLLRASITGGDLIFNFLRSDDLSIASCVFKIDDVVREIRGNISTVIPDHKNVMSVLRKELIEPVFSRVTHSATGTQTPDSNPRRSDPFSPDASDPRADPLRVEPRRPQVPTWPDPILDPRSVGRSDLDPFARPGGGMIFDPFASRGPRNPLAEPGPHGLPRGAIPPGARFDPFGPPGMGGRGGNRRPDPDPDHLPPPGYDDMFM